MHPTALRNGAFGEPDDRAVTEDGGGGGNVDERDLVGFGDVLDKRKTGRELGACRETALVHDDGHRVVRVHLHVERT